MKPTSKKQKTISIRGLILIVLFMTSYTVLGDYRNILLDSEDDFLCQRTNITKAKDGKGGYFCVMSANKYSELIWVPPLGKLTNVEIELETVSALKGYWWIRIIDAENEEFRSPPNKNIEIASCTNSKKNLFDISSFSKCKWSKKGDGVVSYPLKRLYLIFYPRPSHPDKTIKFYLRSAKGKYNDSSKGKYNKSSPKCDEFNDFNTQWRLINHDGASGKLTKNSKGEYILEKKSGTGYVELRTRKPILLKGGKTWYLRGKYQSLKASLGTLFMFRFATGANSDAVYNCSGDRGVTISTETMLLNTSPGKWLKRNYAIKPPKDFKYYPSIILAGNPAKVKIKDLTLDDKPKVHHPLQLTGTEKFKYTVEQVEGRLLKRKNATAKLVSDTHGITRIAINGKIVPPTLYKPTNNIRFWRIENFKKAEVPMVMVHLPLSHQLFKPGIPLAKGKYNWTLLSNKIYQILRYNPEANIVLNLYTYEPWFGWGNENPNEIWQNEKGLRGLGNNCHLKFFSNSPEKENLRMKLGWWPSYSSLKWRNDMGCIIKDVMGYIDSQAYGKAIVGVAFSGGDDGQFQYRKDDFSPVAQKAFRKFLKEKYINIAKLNKTWQTSYSDFKVIDIPLGCKTSKTPFLNSGAHSDYRLFQSYEGWLLREAFAKAAKKGIKKDILTFAYGAPDSFLPDHLDLVPSLDVITTVTGYPYRNNRYPVGINAPELEYSLYKKLWFNELDMRSWTTSIGCEFIDHWQGAQLTPEAWTNAHRKLVGISLAARQGWWYYSMDYLKGRFFDSSAIMKEIKKTIKISKELINLPYNPFHPDVCLVVSDVNDRYIKAKPFKAHVNLNAQCNSLPFQQFMLNSCGVPMDKVFLDDILKYPELQKYKVYIFPHISFISQDQRRLIEKKLKKHGRIIIWTYSTGYISENGKSAKNIKDLTGFNVRTEEKYIRKNAIAETNNTLMKNVPPFLSFGDLRLFAQSPKGINIWGSPAQNFRLEDVSKKNILANYTDGGIAGAIKYFPGWTSIYLADHSSISNIFLNNIAEKADAYRTGKAGHSIFMNGNFVSIHALYDDFYEFITPPGVKEVKNAFTGALLGKAPKVKLDLKVGETLWLLLLK